MSDVDELVACPQCDALHYDRLIAEGETARCKRCRTRLMAPRTGAYNRIIALALTNIILMVAALFFPFLSISASGLGNTISLVDATRSFLAPGLWPFTLLTAAFIIAIPLARFAAIIYTLWPLMHGAPPYRHARHAFRMAAYLEPWSMVEIFVLGVAVALIKFADLAQIEFGAGFWALSALVMITLLQDNFMSRHTVWKLIEAGR